MSFENSASKNISTLEDVELGEWLFLYRVSVTIPNNELADFLTGV